MGSFLTSHSAVAFYCRDVVLEMARAESLFNSYISYRRDRLSIYVPYSYIPKENVEIIASKSLSPDLLKRFVEDQFVRWPHHPYNENPDVPYFNQKLNAEHAMDGYLTSSRSIVSFLPNDAAFSVKIPTSHPHPKQHHSKKSYLAGELVDAIWVTDYIEAIEVKSKDKPDYFFLKDRLAIRDNKTKNGFTVRDLTPLQTSGMNYLPGVALSTIGPKIAKEMGIPFFDFCRDHYAVPIGKVKAHLLLRYGLTMTSGHAQNLLIEMDPKTGRPTGRLVIRDLSDLELIEAVTQSFPKGTLPKDHPTEQEFSLTADKAYGLFKADALPRSSVDKLPVLELNSFLKEFDLLLGSSLNLRVRSIEEEEAVMKKVYDYLASPAGQVKLRQFNGN